MKFYQWLIQQTKRNDPIGDFANDVISDKCFPTGATNLSAVLTHLTVHLASQDANQAAKDAWQEYKNSVA